MMVWTAPDGIDCARMRSLQISDNGDRPWNRLAELAWTRRSIFSRRDLRLFHDPDLAIIDITLQDGNSVELAKKLCGRKIPFLVVSGYPAESDGIDEIFKSAPWVVKPVTPASLQSALQSLIA